MAKKAMFRLLEADEIECRVGAGGNNNATWCTLLLYKDARVDQRLLDEQVGPFYWQCEYREINGRLYCSISIFNKDTGNWVSKEDVGTESNTEKEKGQASDAFKRAGFKWGIGRELYTAPLVMINLTPNDYRTDGRLKTRFTVTYIAYDDNRKIKDLEVVDDKGNIRYKMVDGKAQRITQPQPQQPKLTPAQELKIKENYEEAVEDLQMATTYDEFKAAWDRHPDLKNDARFRDVAKAIGQRFK